MAGLAAGVLAFAGGAESYFGLALVALLLCAMGTVDDRRTIGPRPRIVAEVVAAVLLWEFGFGWDLFTSDTANLALTVIWVLGVVNAINLLDLMDGVATSTVAACAAGLAGMAVVGDDLGLAVLALAVVGPCVGFLRYNLASPARMFLGDGGTMPIGVVMAALTISVPLDHGLGTAAVPAGILLLGAPLVDLAYRVQSRIRMGIPLNTPGPDSLANWLFARARSARIVSATFVGVQLLVALIAIAASAASPNTLVMAWGACSLVGVAIVTFIDPVAKGRKHAGDREVGLSTGPAE